MDGARCVAAQGGLRHADGCRQERDHLDQPEDDAGLFMPHGLRGKDGLPLPHGLRGKDGLPVPHGLCVVRMASLCLMASAW